MRCAGSDDVLLRRLTAGLYNVGQVSLVAVFHMWLLKINIDLLILNTYELKYELYFSQTTLKYVYTVLYCCYVKGVPSISPKIFSEAIWAWKLYVFCCMRSQF